MDTANRRTLTDAVRIFDLFVLIASFAAATIPVLAAEGPISFANFLAIRIKLQNFVVFFVLLGIWHTIFLSMKLYDSKRLTSRLSEFVDILKATTLSGLFLSLASFLVGFRMVTLMFVAIFWACSTILIGFSRIAIRTYLRQLRKHGKNSRNMLIVGSNRRAIEFAQSIQARPELGYRILGFADDQWAGSEDLQQHGWSVICNLQDLRMFLRRSVVDEVVIAVPLRSFHDYASEIASTCEQQGIILRVLSDLFNLKNRPPRADHVADSPLITHYSGVVEGWPTVIKRGLDIFISLIALILLAPLLLITAVFIKLTSEGPILFVQERIGFNKRPFAIYKFRTMVVDAEKKLREIEHLNEVSGPVFKIKNDPRITPIGKFLRKTSIDELPQLFNVLSGDMSLVGPRPLQVRDYELFTEAGEDWQRCRFSVRPGITCLWQVKGRSSLPFHQWMELDLQYVRNWSLWLDLQILAKTIPAVLRGSGAA
jgi:exopolysaccharide biosynthesis polyprenyl glycosylphosphotransferase